MLPRRSAYICPAALNSCSQATLVDDAMLSRLIGLSRGRRSVAQSTRFSADTLAPRLKPNGRRVEAVVVIFLAQRGLSQPRFNHSTGSPQPGRSDDQATDRAPKQGRSGIYANLAKPHP